MLGFVIGDADMVTGFRLVGVEGVEVTSVDEAAQALDGALARSDLAIVIISEEFSSKPLLQERIESVGRERREPLIVEVPGSKEKPNETRMSDLISKILGMKI